jgi:hypothetical protein
MWAYLPMESHDGRVSPLEVVLCQMDSMSAAGWLRKSNFNEEAQPIQLDIARAVAILAMDGGFALFSQWFPGEENDVSDSLSRDTDLPCDQLTHLLLSSVPDQVPPDFAIFPLLPELCSQLETWLLKLPKLMLSLQPPVRSKLCTGQTILHSSKTSSSPVTPSLPVSNHGYSTTSWGPLPLPTMMAASHLIPCTLHRASRRRQVCPSRP